MFARRPSASVRCSLTCTHSGVARNLSRGEQIRGGLGTEVPQQGPGSEPQWGSGGKAPEADEFTTKMFGILIAR